MEDAQPVFHEDRDPIALNACSYLHNYPPVKDDPILAPKFAPLISEFRLFMADDVDLLTQHLREYLGRGDGMHALHRIQESKYRPSKKLLDHVGRLLDGRSEYGCPLIFNNRPGTIPHIIFLSYSTPSR